MPRKRRRTPPGGEFRLIERLIEHLPAAAGTVIGPGDDAAVVRLRRDFDLVITVDALVEGRHFRRRWASIPGLGARLPGMIGSRLAAANVSDLAAMGATPRWAVLSAGVKRRGAAWLERVQTALARALRTEGATLVGGNLCRVSGPEWLSLTLFGEVRRARALRRAGARVGDLIAITGSPGRAAAFVALANAGRSDRALTAAWSAPRSRIALARALAGRRLAHAATDLSDGVAGDLAHLCRASGVAAELEAREWPLDAVLVHALQGSRASRARRGSGRARTSSALQARALAMALGPSDDYELLLAVPGAARRSCERLARALRVPLAFVGRFTRGVPGAVSLRHADGRLAKLEARGYDHFADR